MKTVHSSPFRPDLVQNFCRLEPPTWRDRWQWLWQSCLQKLQSRPEPRVWQVSDRHKRQKAWQVYDPTNGGVTCFGSELEVRLWLEQRYR